MSRFFRTAQTVVLALGLCLCTPLPAHADGGVTSANLTCDSGATAWMLTSTALVLLMVPGLAMFYGGLVRTKNVLGTMMHSFGAMAIIGVLWAAVGYALSFGPSIWHGFVGWDPTRLFLNGADGAAYPITGGKACVPELVYAMYATTNLSKSPSTQF